MTYNADTLATSEQPYLAALRRDLIEAESATQKARWPDRADEVRAEIARIEANLAVAASAEEPEPDSDEIEQRKQARRGRKGRVERARRAPRPGEAA